MEERERDEGGWGRIGEKWYRVFLGEFDNVQSFHLLHLVLLSSQTGKLHVNFRECQDQRDLHSSPPVSITVHER